MPKQVKYGHWCPECNINRKKTVDEMKEFATKKGCK
jgi:hypothetical protein